MVGETCQATMGAPSFSRILREGGDLDFLNAKEIYEKRPL
jgi:hypothetical protein